MQTIEELEAALDDILPPGFTIETDDNWQVIILTGLQQEDDGELIVFEGEDDDVDPDFEPLEDEDEDEDDEAEK